MKYKLFFYTILLFFSICSCVTRGPKIQQDFVYVKQYIPNIVVDLRYYRAHNFTGRRVEGYKKPVLLMTRQATEALVNVQTDLAQKRLGLKVYDAYRPQSAVNSFETWAKNINDTIAKAEFYPDVDKRNLFTLGYIASKSGHSRGSTIDLTIINLDTQKELDMGSNFDFFGSISHQDTTQITEEQKANRKTLRDAMLKYHFKDYHEEWWHFTLIDEPFPNTYFNFPVL